MWDDEDGRHPLDRWTDERREAWAAIDSRREKDPEPAGPPEAAPEPPRAAPVLRKVYDVDAVEPEPVEAPPASRPDLLAVARSWAQRRLADIEAEIRYRRLVDKKNN